MGSRHGNQTDNIDLFSTKMKELGVARSPLADRMRPRRLDEYIGQLHLLGPGKLLRRAIEADRVRSLILYGPPGTGKTTLAKVIAAHSNATFRDLNAILSGVKVIREEVQNAQDRMTRFGQQTLLFIDEIHRFNQAQQDALLPWVERGVVTLIGATTENPYFEVNAALNSRSHIFQLTPLSEAELHEVVKQALHDKVRGYGTQNIQLSAEALSHWARIVNGDARALLNALEVAVETTPVDEHGVIQISLNVAEESIQERAVVYDRSGDAHFDHMSALIKSMRGSDADAALYWLAKMIYAGEPARSIFRRLFIFASEDIGLAWSQGISIVHACAEAFDRVGMPEGRFHLAHATLALATAPKSNSTMGFFDALHAVEQAVSGEIPLHLKDGHRDGDALGHGKGYLYPHAYAQHWVAQEYLPEALKGRVFYNPSQEGEENDIGQRHQALREAQLEGTLYPQAHPIIRSVSPDEKKVEEWTTRAMGQDALHWQTLRKTAFDLLQLERDSVVLDLNPTTGIFTWAGLRASPEGGVYCWCLDESSATLIQAQAQPLPWLHQPRIAFGTLDDLKAQVSEHRLRFDRVIAQRLFDTQEMVSSLSLLLKTVLQSDGRALLIEPNLESSSLLDAFLEFDLMIDSDLIDAWKNAENQLLKSEIHPVFRATLDDRQEHVRTLFAQHGMALEQLMKQTHVQTQRLSSKLLTALSSLEPQSYLSKLSQHGLSAENAQKICSLFNESTGLTLKFHHHWWLFLLRPANP